MNEAVKKEKILELCEECNTPLVRPRAGYVVCPNCGLIHYDSRLDFSGVQYTHPYPRFVDSYEYKRLKKWDRVSYREARKIYITNYIYALFSRFVSKNVMDMVIDDIIKEIDNENEKDKRQFHLEARFMKHLQTYASQPLITKILEENPDIENYLKRYATPKRIQSDSERDFKESMEKLKRFNVKYYKYAFRVYEIKKPLLYKTKGSVRAAVCMAYAEKMMTKKKQTRLVDYCRELGINAVSARKVLRKISKNTANELGGL